ncbi:MAG: hypothetical protein ACRD0D_14925, partial [Acidimicrobiales bacterium]
MEQPGQGVDGAGEVPVRRLSALVLVAATSLAPAAPAGAGGDPNDGPPPQPRTRVDGPTIVASAHAPAL